MTQEYSETKAGSPDVIISLDNAQEKLLNTISYEMIDLILLARPRELRDAWANDDYHRITESSDLFKNLDKLVDATNVIKLMAQSPELNLLERAGSLQHVYGFTKIRKERKKNLEVRPSQPAVPFSSFELVLYRQMAEGTDYWFWKCEEEITQSLAEAMDANPAVAWQTMQQFGIDMLFPALSHIQRKERAVIARTIKQEMSKQGNKKTGCEIFCDALVQAGVIQNDESIDKAELWRRTVQLLPQLYAYYDRNIPDNEPQSHEYYMHIALALAHYSAIKGSGPFGATIVDQYGFMLGTTNEIDSETGLEVHAETVLMKKAHTFWGPQIKGLTLYSTAEPCFGCAKEILHGNPVIKIVYGVPTTMGMDYFGISTAKHLTQLECGDPEIIQGVLEKQIRTFYTSVGYIDLIRPET